MASSTPTDAAPRDPQDQPRPSRRRRRPSPSDDELFGKAFAMFLEQGYEGATIDAISAEAGVAKRTLYARFVDKSGLFKAVVDHAVKQWLVPVERLRAAECADLEETLVAIGQLLINNLLTPAGLQLLQLTSTVSTRLPEIGAHNVRRGIEPTVLHLADLLRNRVGPHLCGFSGMEEAALAFINLVVIGPANIVALGVTVDGAFIDRYVRSSVSLFLHGLLPTPHDASFAALEQGNRRLKLLLAETMMELDAARQECQALRRLSAASGNPPAADAPARGPHVPSTTNGPE